MGTVRAAMISLGILYWSSLAAAQDTTTQALADAGLLSYAGSPAGGADLKITFGHIDVQPGEHFLQPQTLVSGFK